MKPFHPLLGSSVDPQELSLTIKGAVFAVLPVFVLIFQMNGIDITENELIDFVNTAMTALSSVMILVGLARKFYIKVKDSDFINKLK